LLRWVAIGVEEADPTIPANPAEPPVTFTIDGDLRRTLVIRVALADEPDRAARIVALCEDIALHDWLLTTLLDQMERSRVGAADPSYVIGRLRPAIDHLLHLWMPAARIDPAVEPLWAGLERRPGFSRQWKASVEQVRDQVAVNSIALLSAAIPAGSRT
jgi:hypothetical protein